MTQLRYRRYHIDIVKFVYTFMSNLDWFVLLKINTLVIKLIELA